MSGAACVALTLMWADTSMASAWNPAAGSGEIISGYVQSEATESVDTFGDTVPLDVFRKRISQNYATVGLTDHLALIGTFDWQDTQIIGPGLEIAFSKPSAMTTGLQFQLQRKDRRAVAFSMSYIEGIDLPSQLITVAGRRSSLEVRGLWGESREFRGRNLFGEVQMAARQRFSGGFGGVEGQLTVGAEPTDFVKIIGKMRYAREEGGIYQNIAVDRQTRWQTEISGVLKVRKRDWVELGYVATLTGRNAVKERGVKLAYWRKF